MADLVLPYVGDTVTRALDATESAPWLAQIELVVRLLDRDTFTRWARRYDLAQLRERERKTQGTIMSEDGAAELDALHRELLELSVVDARGFVRRGSPVADLVGTGLTLAAALVAMRAQAPTPEQRGLLPGDR